MVMKPNYTLRNTLSAILVHVIICSAYSHLWYRSLAFRYLQGVRYSMSILLCVFKFFLISHSIPLLQPYIGIFSFETIPTNGHNI